MPIPPGPNPFAATDICRIAYDFCLQLGQQVTQTPGADAPRAPTLHPEVAGKSLGHLLVELGKGQEDPCCGTRLATDINSFEDDVTRIELAGIDMFVRVCGWVLWTSFPCLFLIALTCKRVEERTPQPSTCSSPPVEEQSESSREILSYARAIDLALSREDYRCMISRTFNYPSIQEFPPVRQNYEDVFRAGTITHITQLPTTLHAAHIIPQSIHAGLSVERPWASSVLAVLSRFGCDNRLMELDGDIIHRLENVMMLRGDWHNLFDNLWIRLKEIPGSRNTYHFAFPKKHFRLSRSPIMHLRMSIYHSHPTSTLHCMLHVPELPNFLVPAIMSTRFRTTSTRWWCFWRMNATADTYASSQINVH